MPEQRFVSTVVSLARKCGWETAKLAPPYRWTSRPSRIAARVIFINNMVREVVGVMVVGVMVVGVMVVGVMVVGVMAISNELLGNQLPLSTKRPKSESYHPTSKFVLSRYYSAMDEWVNV